MQKTKILYELYLDNNKKYEIREEIKGNKKEALSTAQVELEDRLLKEKIELFSENRIISFPSSKVTCTEVKIDNGKLWG